MYIDRRVFVRMLKTTLEQLLDEVGNNSLEKITKDAHLKDKLTEVATRLAELQARNRECNK